MDRRAEESDEAKLDASSTWREDAAAHLGQPLSSLLSPQTSIKTGMEAQVVSLCAELQERLSR